MFRHLVVIAAALLAPAAQATDGNLPETVNWMITPGAETASEVQFTLSYRTARSRSTWSNTTALSELQGLDPAALAAAQESRVQFWIVRAAGRFDCEGVVRRQRGNGACRFEDDAGFAAALTARGIGTPSREDQYQLALARVGLALVEELDRQHYARPSVEDLVAAGIHGADAGYVRTMAEAGYRVGNVDALVAMRIHGVTPDYVGALAAAGYRPDADTAVSMRIHGVTPAYLSALARAGAGAGRFTPENLIAMRIHGVTPEFVAELRELGYSDLSASDLTSLRIHGVTGDFVRRAIGRSATRPSAAELISRRIHGGT